MKNLTLFLAVLVVALLPACAQDRQPKSAPPRHVSSGVVSFSIDISTVPRGVTQVSAELTRDGFDKRVGTIRLLGDTTADISFTKVPAGVWHFNAEAKNRDSVVSYAGQTDVTVREDSNTLVNLSLTPVSGGTGGVRVVARWKTESRDWIDCPSNPIFSGGENAIQARWVFGPQILYDGGVYKMWYNNTTWQSQTRVISYASSVDGIVWNPGSPAPVLEPGSSMDWDYNNVGVGPVIKNNGLYRMYYGNSSDHLNPWRIGVATSEDGIHWFKYPKPVLSGALRWEKRIGAGEVMKVGDTFYLYYSAMDYDDETSIGLAMSTDGISFVRNSDRPILQETEPWEKNGVCSPSIVVEENGTYTMVYGNGISSGLGLATSSDGRTWTKDPNNPFFTFQDVTNGWTKRQIAYICFRKFGKEYRVYYSGYDPTKNLWMIGFARKK